MLTKRRAQGVCELCSEAAPFKDSKDQPYLETHHIKWLAEGGEDSIENTVALCPNCHRKMHVLNLQSDREKLLQLKAVKLD
jgi:5-methylcytosine-specific restriction protein A